MLSKLLLASMTFALTLGVASAETAKGKIKAIDTEKKTITLTVGDKEMTFETDKEVKITALTLGKKKMQVENPIAGVGALTTGAEATVTFEKKDDKNVASSIRQEFMAKKKKKDKTT